MSTEFRTKEYTTTEVLLMVAQTQFRGFTQRDGYAWAGCESESPQIGEFRHPDGRVTTIVIDGASLNLLDSSDDQCDVHEGRMYDLVDKND